MAEIGPVQMLVLAFDSDAKFEGKVIEQLSALESDSTIRILDLLFTLKDENGELVALDYQSESLGAIAGALLGFEFEGDETAAESQDTTQHAFGLSQADIENVGASLEPGQAAAFLLIEHVWARDLKRAIRDAGGIPVAEGFLTPEAVRAVEPELAAMADAMQEVEREQSPVGA